MLCTLNIVLLLSNQPNPNRNIAWYCEIFFQLSERDFHFLSLLLFACVWRILENAKKKMFIQKVLKFSNILKCVKIEKNIYEHFHKE